MQYVIHNTQNLVYTYLYIHTHTHIYILIGFKGELQRTLDPRGQPVDNRTVFRTSPLPQKKEEKKDTV